MKPKSLFSLIMALNLPLMLCSQPIVDVQKVSTITPFNRGTFQWPLTRNFHYDNFQLKSNDLETGKENNLFLNLAPTYFISNNFGLGFELESIFSGLHPEGGNTDLLIRRNMFYGNFTYGTSFSNNFNLYARAGIGTGTSKFIFKTQSGENTDKANVFGLNFEIGAPLPFGGDTGTFIVPVFEYSYLKEKFDDATNKEHTYDLSMWFFRNVDFTKKLPKPGNQVLSDTYREQAVLPFYGGNYWYNFYTYFDNVNNFDIRERLYGDVGLTFKLNNNFRIRQTYRTTQERVWLQPIFYPTNNLGVGADFGFRNFTEKNDTTGTKRSSFVWGFAPMIEVYVPSTNLFLQGGGGIGGATIKTETSGNATTLKYTNNTFGSGLGFNFFFSPNTSITPILGYQWNSIKDKDTENVEKSNGIVVNIRSRYFLRR